MAGLLDELLAQLNALPKEERDKVVEEAMTLTKASVWIPNPGPQTDAFFSEADEIFYGGQAGGGKTDLSLGLSITQHKRSLVLRRTNKEAAGLVERMAEILGTRDGWSSQQGTWRLEGRLIDMGGCQLEEDKQKYKGVPHDLICFDEVSDFSETQYTFISAWNRSADSEQRCRVIATGNPPTRPEGYWVMRRWAAWLDPKHHNPAKPGELRWYTTGADGKEIEVEGKGPHIINGEAVYARSRTFIPAKLSDNPDLAATNYDAVLAGLPERERLAYRDGNFQAGLQDELNQVIPTAWVRAAMARWTPQPPAGIPMCAIGCDVAQGGNDSTTLAPRYDGWFDRILKIPGKETPDGPSVAGRVMVIRLNEALPVIDLGGGWGGETMQHLERNGVKCHGYMGVMTTMEKSEDRTLSFFNVRAAAYWKLREALNPAQPGGSRIMLPDDPELLADLCAPTYEIKRPNIVVLESKDDLKKRIGRSPDKGDAVAMAWWRGNKLANIEGGWEKHNRSKAKPNVIMGRVKARGH